MKKIKENKGNKMKEKLSDPSPFNNILNNSQFLLVVVGINILLREIDSWNAEIYGSCVESELT